MRRRRLALCAALSILLATGATATPALAETAPPAGADTVNELNTVMTPELHTRIQKKIEAFMEANAIVGMSVVVVTRDPEGGGPVTTPFTAGLPWIGSETPVEESTQFEIASQTKVFTSDLLAYLVAEGRVSLDDPVQKYAPPGITVPVWTDPDTGEVTQITLRNLATHQAGLVDQPQNFFEACNGCENPHPHYTQAMLWENLQDNPLLWKPGTNWLYSNFSFGLLGTILANVVQPVPETDPPAFEQALKGAFLDDLGMSATVLGHTPKTAHPYQQTDAGPNEPTFFWDDTNALAGEGGLVSSATDMAIWDKAHLGIVEPDAPLGVRTMVDTLAPQSTVTTVCQEPTIDQCAPVTDFRMGLAWQLYPASSSDMGVDWAFKNGGTAGTSSDTVLAPGEKLAVTTMWNKQRYGGTDPEPGIEILSLILHFKDEKKPDPKPAEHKADDHGENRLADTGLEASASALPLGGAAVMVLLGAIAVAATVGVGARRRRGRPQQ